MKKITVRSVPMTMHLFLCNCFIIDELIASEYVSQAECRICVRILVELHLQPMEVCSVKKAIETCWLYVFVFINFGLG